MNGINSPENMPFPGDKQQLTTFNNILNLKDYFLIFVNLNYLKEPVEYNIMINQMYELDAESFNLDCFEKCDNHIHTKM